MNRVFRSAAILLTLLALFSLPTISRGDESAPDKDQAAAIDELIEQITEGGNQRVATEQLLKLGKPVVEPLAKAAEVDDAGAMTRCFDVLGRLLVSDDQETANAAQEAVEKLTESDIDLVGRRARTMLRLKDAMRQREALLKGIPGARLGAAGNATMTTSENGRTTQLKRAADGSFSGTIKENVEGKEKVTPISAESEKELEEKYPDVHKNYKKQQQQQAVPAIRPGIQINGQIIGGANVQSMKVSIVNNKRHVEVENADEKVDITDTNGKEIELKHTHQVDGKQKTDEYKADDLDDLKNKHPEAAKLYEKYTAGQRIGVGPGAGGIQLRIGGGVPGGIGAPVVRPVPGFRPTIPTPNPSDGTRTIRSELDGRKIEITDTDGMKIRIKLIKEIDGKEVTQEFTADDLKTLRAEHPEAARLYEQLTGRKE